MKMRWEENAILCEQIKMQLTTKFTLDLKQSDQNVLACDEGVH